MSHSILLQLNCKPTQIYEVDQVSCSIQHSACALNLCETALFPAGPMRSLFFLIFYTAATSFIKPRQLKVPMGMREKKKKEGKKINQPKCITLRQQQQDQTVRTKFL